MKYLVWIGLLCAFAACNSAVSDADVTPTLVQMKPETVTSLLPTGTTEPTLTAEPTPAPIISPSPTSTPEWLAYTVDFRDTSQVRFEALPRYELSLILLDSTQGRWEGRADIRYVNGGVTPIPDLLLRLYPNTPGYGGEFKIETLSVDGTPIDPQLEMAGTAARVPLSSPLLPHQTVNISIQYWLTVPYANRAGYGALNREGHVMTLGGFYPTMAVYGPDGWEAELVTGVGDPLHAESAFFAVTVTLPSDYVALTSGLAVESEEYANEMTTHHFTGGPIRDFALVVGRGYTPTVETLGGFRIRFFSDTVEGRAAAQQVLRYTRDALRVYERRFGPYPYTELDVVQSPISASGLEFPGLIQLGPNALNQGDEWLELVVAHEVAHQWWYGLVGNDQIHDAWLDEGLASYASMLYFRDIYGAERAAVLMSAYYQQPYHAQSATYQRTPANLPVSAYSSVSYGPVVYIHATNFFHDLHQVLGEERFTALMRQFREQYGYRIADGEEFLALAKTFDPAAVESLYTHWILGVP